MYIYLLNLHYTYCLMMRVISIFLSIFIIASQPLCSQSKTYEFAPKQMILPAALIGIGAIGSQIDAFKELDFETHIYILTTVLYWRMQSNMHLLQPIMD